MRRRTLTRAVLTVAFAAAVVSGTIQPASADPGDLDPSFDGDGQAVAEFAVGSSGASAVALQADGKILVGGYIWLSDTDKAFALVRFRPGGALDTSFGEQGEVIMNITAEDDVIRALAVVGGSGKILAAGEIGGDFGLARFTADGTRDDTFHGGGWTTVDFAHDLDAAYAVAVAPEGKLVLAGFATVQGVLRFALARLTPGGAKDSTFSGDGRVTTKMGNQDNFAIDVLVQGDGSILAAGTLRGVTADRPAMAAYRPNGTLDPDFGNGGKSVHDVGSDYGIDGVVRLASGKLMMAGSIQKEDGGLDIGLVRFTAAGAPDPSFGSNGLVRRDFGSAEVVTDLRRSGKKLLVSMLRVKGQDQHLAVARFMGDGSKDTSFGVLGIAATTLPAVDAGGVVRQTNGRIVTVGAAGTDEDAPEGFLAARFLAA
ncbi:MAG TPA: hypothetical protein VGB19_12685 [Actinomycetota bacterium]